MIRSSRRELDPLTYGVGDLNPQILELLTQDSRRELSIVAANVDLSMWAGSDTMHAPDRRDVIKR